jgi:hypothetical protein
MLATFGAPRCASTPPNDPKQRIIAYLQHKSTSDVFCLAPAQRDAKLMDFIVEPGCLPRQGRWDSRIATALAHPEAFNHMLRRLSEDSGSRAEKIASERIAGIDATAASLHGSCTFMQPLIFTGGRCRIVCGGNPPSCHTRNRYIGRAQAPIMKAWLVERVILRVANPVDL